MLQIAPKPATRKSVSRDATLKYGRETCWIGGVLYFVGTQEQVPGVSPMPKPGRAALGLAAINVQERKSITRAEHWGSSTHTKPKKNLRPQSAAKPIRDSNGRFVSRV